MVYHNFTVKDAIKYSKCETSASALYARKVRYEAKMAATRMDEAAASSLVSLSRASTPSSKKAPGQGECKSPMALSFDTTSATKSVAMDALVENLPGWVDKASVAKTLARTRRRTSAEVNLANFEHKANYMHHKATYSRAYKAATEEYAKGNDGISTKRGMGLRAIADRYNKEMLWAPRDKQLTKAAIHGAFVRGQCGVSPLRKGPPVKVTPEITGQLAMQAAMMQAAGQGEANSSNMRKAIFAMTVGTEHGTSMDTEYVFKKARASHPEVFTPVLAKNDDDRRIEWMTYKNINDWTDMVKEELIRIDMVVNKPGLISKWSFVLCNSLIL